MSLPEFPRYSPISLSMRDALHPHLSMLKDGVSEYTFANLYLFRNTYDYQISRISEDRAVISGTKDGKRFFLLPCGIPEDTAVLQQLFENHDYLKGLSEENTLKDRILLEKHGYTVIEDRDNFDYLYLKKDLAALSGRKFHKKRNLVNGFVNNYQYQEGPLTRENLEGAFHVLEEWRRERNDLGDYEAAREALELMDELDLKGYLVWVEGTPAAYTLGESLSRGRSFAVHFEKAVGNYKGIYQFINRAFASVLPRHYKYINREQDLGDPGLRQAKMTYRPCGFVKKYRVYPASSPALMAEELQLGRNSTEKQTYS